MFWKCHDRIWHHRSEVLNAGPGVSLVVQSLLIARMPLESVHTEIWTMTVIYWQQKLHVSLLFTMICLWYAMSEPVPAHPKTQVERCKSIWMVLVGVHCFPLRYLEILSFHPRCPRTRAVKGHFPCWTMVVQGTINGVQHPLHYWPKVIVHKLVIIIRVIFGRNCPAIC